MAVDNGRVPVTQEEEDRLKSELHELIRVKRPEIAKKIARAAADGDLSENGAYHDAKEQQGHIEGRIQELEYLVRNALVVQPLAGKVGLGSTVHITDDGGEAKTYRLVSRHSARPREGLISDESPIGKAIMGHSPGETVTYETPNGHKSVTIQSIE
jgi:transcription elongation factor GreA